ncbi:glycosyltransferase, group 2 family protein [Leptospira inadai serovar Lyme str. 10]|uniref:Glycosyltransferase, group 2 family protein n=2 Tax=Leptospira inadai serovar Lyme TaxID=293084 RepID=V6HEB8_9LEPT|nr:glycosyltransferase family 2 protein [Leptospira inadai]EQA37648.1 glycosyltransferase, group 2 family protein [Leptospira inadai serovar Lyme str. 10]PNV76269.1 glycosyl transferase [Leptospira inadai serovar Lyme]
MKDKRIAVIIPAYNEEITIRETILSFYKELPNAVFWVVDNNSKDKTNLIATETFKKHKIKGSVLFENRQGKANAVRKAFSLADADVYVMSDADTTYPADEVRKLTDELVKNELDMVVGDRLSRGDYGRENKRMFHSLGNQLVIRLINFLFSVKLRDAMSGYRVFSRKFVKNYPILASGFELEIEMTLHALDKRFAIREIPIQYKDRPSGSFSKLNTFRDGYRVVNNILWIFKDYKPMHFFGFLSVIAFIAAIASGSQAVWDYWKYKYVYHVPLAILATGLMIASILNFSIGLILHTVAKIQRFNFELQLLKYKEE